MGRIRDISNISIKREEVVSEGEHLPHTGKGSTLPSPCIHGGCYQTQVLTDFPVSKPLALSLCSLFIPNTK